MSLVVLYLLQVIDSSIDLGLIDYLIINVMERAGDMYGYNWPFSIVYLLSLFLIPLKGLVLDMVKLNNIVYVRLLYCYIYFVIS